MVDAEEDRERTANDLAEAKREMRANKARLAVGDVVRTAKRGTLSSLPAAPVAAPVAVPQDGAGLVPAVVADPPAQSSGFVPATSFTQLMLATALVAVLIVVWIVERRSSARDKMEDQDVR